MFMCCLIGLLVWCLVWVVICFDCCGVFAGCLLFDLRVLLVLVGTCFCWMLFGCLLIVLLWCIVVVYVFKLVGCLLCSIYVWCTWFCLLRCLRIWIALLCDVCVIVWSLLTVFEVVRLVIAFKLFYFDLCWLSYVVVCCFSFVVCVIRVIWCLTLLRSDCLRYLFI